MSAPPGGPVARARRAGPRGRPGVPGRLADPFAPDALDALTHPTPYLLVDLDRVELAWRTLAGGLGVDDLHHTVGTNADPGVLRTLHRLGCRFEVGSAFELDALYAVGVDPAETLYANPVKPAEHLHLAYRAGCRRFAADGRAELVKLAEHAPGSAVVIRLRRPHTGAAPDAPGASDRSGAIDPSANSLGVDPAHATALLHAAAALGLDPYGLSVAIDADGAGPNAWAEAIDAAGAVMAALDEAGIRLTVLRFGGVDSGGLKPDAVGAAVRDAVDRLPYRPRVVAEASRALVAEAGVLVASVIGTALRGGRDWVHLDVGNRGGPTDAGRYGFAVSDSRRAAATVACHLAGPTGEPRDVLGRDVPVSAGLVAGDRVYLGGTGASTGWFAATAGGFAPPETRSVWSGAIPADPTASAA